MENSRTKNSVLTMVTSGIRQILTILLAFGSRTVFIYVLGASYLGLNGLFSNVLSLLALTELGIGGAITYYLYKPIAEDNVERIKTLMQFYRKCYRWVGIAILSFGCLLMPFLNKMVNLDQPIPENLYLIYFLYVLNSSLSYLFWAYKQTLMTASQKQYKIEKINIAFTFISCLTDIVVLLLFRNFIAYLVSKMVVTVAKNVIIAIMIDREFPYLKDNYIVPLAKDEKKKFLKDVTNVSIFKLGSTLFNSTLNIIVSMFIGTSIVGYYSNYYMVIGQVNTIFGLIMLSVTAGIGNVVATESKEKVYQVYKNLDMGVFLVNVFCTICMFQLFNSFVNIWLGRVSHQYVLSQLVVGLICLDFFVNSSCQIIATFKNASGLFSVGRDRQVIAGIVNIPLSIGLIKLFGLPGAFLSPLLCKIFITVCPFMIDLGRMMFEKSWTTMMVDYGRKMLILVVTSAIIWAVCYYLHERTISYFIVETVITVISAIALPLLFIWRTSEVKALRNKIHIPAKFRIR